MVYHHKKYQQQEADKRSLCLHECIAHKLLAESDLMPRVIETLEQRYQQKLLSYGAYINWQVILAQVDTPSQFIAAMTATDKTTTALRRKTIFVGILNEKERSDCLAALFE
ncbi:hypothetical protein [Alteromonas lipolytica]|uniref:Uncharacterized protein n=1 Tax=Alteromonas lipolytica TaxID=1856405 RepID=A0A1E8FFX2_9ALTE|nr:hypothetical protein [Alteromonas lipolytica]OFI34373.1 hypothetical protein BFC17_18515 [Alteromonas lipolytica]GGF82013.1 hypothetical protein GCM10011338_37840 [Alteromonas lipolytica]